MIDEVLTEKLGPNNSFMLNESINEQAQLKVGVQILSNRYKDQPSNIKTHRVFEPSKHMDLLDKQWLHQIRYE